MAPITFSDKALPIISDIHGNARALRQVLKHMQSLGLKNPPLLLGDLLWNGYADYDALEVLDVLRQTPLAGAVLGNTDQWILNGRLERWAAQTELDRAEKQSMLRLKQRLTPDHVAFLEQTPTEFAFTFEGQSVLALHASPLDIDRGLTLDLSPAEARRLLGGRQPDYLIAGHLHQSFIHRYSAFTHVSVGAVGKHPPEYDGIIHYAVLEHTPNGVAMIQLNLVQQQAPTPLIGDLPVAGG